MTIARGSCIAQIKIPYQACKTSNSVRCWILYNGYRWTKEAVSYTLIYKMLKNLLPSYFNQFLTHVSELHNYPTSSSTNLYVNPLNLKSSMNFLFFKGIDEFNKLPGVIKNSKSLYIFKNGLKKHLKN